MPSMTFNPDPHPEITSVDGRARHSIAENTWATVRDGAGTHAYDSENGWNNVQIIAGTTQDKWTRIIRSILLFDTSPLPADATITGVVLSVWGYGKSDSGGWVPTVNVYSSAPASNVELVPGDYATLGIEALATAITYAGWNTAGYNNFTLIDVNADNFATNADGNYIDKTGISKLGLRLNYDVLDTPPTWGSLDTAFFHHYYSEIAAGKVPKLVVTYTVPAVGRSYGFIIG